MRYVMVPVPEEHVLDVMRWVLFRAPDEEGASVGRDAARIGQFMEETDEASRSIVALVAGAALRNEPLTLNDAGVELGISPKDLSAMITQINRVALGGDRVLVNVAAVTEVGVHSKTGQIAYLSMRPEVARIVRPARAAKAPSPAAADVVE